MRALAAFANPKWQPVASLVALLLAWQIAATLAGDRLFPPPLAVIAALQREIAHGELPWHLSITLLRVTASFALAMVCGTALGIALGRIEAFDRWARPWVVVALNVPALVVVILSYVWLGLVELALLMAVAANKIPNVAMTVREGARALERDYTEVATVYRFGLRTRLRHVILPQIAPYLIASARNGLALIWKIVLVVELLGRSNGVGFQLGLFFQMFDVTSILAYSIAFVIVIQAIEFALLQPMERRVTRWRR